MICAANPLLTLVCVAMRVYVFILFARAILSWIVVLGARPPASGPLRTITDLLEDVTEPALRPLRRLMPPVRAGGMGIDLSMVILFVILLVLQQAICR